MYRDIVIKKRVWMPEDSIDVYQMFEDHDFDLEPFEIESTIVDFNGRIPIEDGIVVGEWMTNGIQLIKAGMGELLSEGVGKIQSITPKSIDDMLETVKPIPGSVLPIGIYKTRYTQAVRLSNGEQSTDIDIKYFQYIYEGGFDYNLFLQDGFVGLALKRDGLVCGAVLGIQQINSAPIWERPYAQSDVESLAALV